MIILAFDLATRTGIAFGPAAGSPSVATEVLSDPGDPQAAKFAQAIRMAQRYIRDLRPDLVVIEEAIAAGPKSKADRVRIAMGLRGAVLGVAHISGIRNAPISVGTARKHFIGVGNLRSKEAKAAVFRRCRLLGWPVTNEDESDACAIWEYGRAMTRSAMTLPAGLFDGRA